VSTTISNVWLPTLTPAPYEVSWSQRSRGTVRNAPPPEDEPLLELPLLLPLLLLVPLDEPLLEAPLLVPLLLVPPLLDP
jgi:hypothetical protein